jgi:hypothetical protein
VANDEQWKGEQQIMNRSWDVRDEGRRTMKTNDEDDE